jgi:flagellar protein FliL
LLRIGIEEFSMSEEEDGGPAAAPSAGKSKALPILLVINTLLLAGVLVFVMKRPAAQAHATADEKTAGGHGEEGGGEHGEGKEKSAGGHGDEGPGGGPGPTVRFDNFTVQLKSLDVDRYAHLGLEIEVGDEPTKAIVEKKVAPIRDLILSYLSDRTPDELRGSDGLKQMKEAMVKSLEELVPGHRIRAIYVTDFIIQ